MEEQLISEIERRPVLYDRSVQACKKMSARDDAWREVADIMKQTEPEVKKRWRTLRDSFMRFHRLQRTCGPKGKKKTWMYYHEMAFLIPHIEPREYKMAGFDGNEYDQETMDNGRQDSHAADMVSIASDMCETELTTPPIGSVVQCHCFADSHGGGGGMGPQLGAQEPVEHGDKRKRPADDPDSDEHFALSCVAALRKLTARKNAEIRMRILQILYEAEYGEEPVLK
ncbi:uncharacterized protein LOC126837904 [Adelges cooleyi]|uniref:uncharacterized protein LOC126837904 n=1 Tax=Adelges cooleyi TaxID=133065 RepID=UPI002180739E|nr:uncharacterized protein LOC126837904 [Adelges cooleyi]